MPVSEPTVFIVDDDPSILTVLRRIAETVQLRVETFTSPLAFLEQCDPQQPGCLVLDVRMPGMNGLDLLDVLAARGIKLPAIVLSGHGDIRLAIRAVRAGALDFLEKPPRPQDLLDRIFAALELDAARRQREESCRDLFERYATLTSRERDVMRLLVEGKTGKQVASALGISYKTMEKFRGKVMRKIAAGSVAELVFASIKLGLVAANRQTENAAD